MIPGMESEKRLRLILSLTSIRNEPQERALQQYFVNGLNASACAALEEITESNFQRAIARVQSVDAIVEQIKELDWARFKSEK
ncbi:hypothetical protein GYL69_003337 [Vibrio vulnificus]|nr:hypothetical protein [Vibrio vulnificus]